jgi:2-phospho-L-lactate guanylyltransferase
MSTAVVPVKALSASKSRLLPELGQDELADLAVAMLEDVLRALLDVPSLDRVAVATPDARVAEAARQLGAEALHGPDPGLNAAIDAAATKLHLDEGEPFLVVLGDVAGARSDELQALFDALGPREAGAAPAVALAPSRDGGTSALLRAPHDAIPSCFGPQSAARHREAAAKQRVAYHELALPSLDLDLDRAEDVEAFLSADVRGERTRRLLEQLGWRQRRTHPGAEG